MTSSAKIDCGSFFPSSIEMILKDHKGNMHIVASETSPTDWNPQPAAAMANQITNNQLQIDHERKPTGNSLSGLTGNC